MKWRIVIGFACCALLGLEAGGAGLAESQAVVLWEAAALRPPGLFPMEFLGAADMDGDGLKDIFCSTPTGPVVFTWDREGGLSAQTCDYYEAREVYRRGNVRVLEPTASMTALAAILRDVDADGLVDLVVSTAGKPSPDGPYGYWLYTLRNRGGQFRREQVLPLPFPIHFLAEWRHEDGSRGLLGVSVQEDESKVVVLPRDDGPAFLVPIVLASGQGWPVAWRDLTGDGRPDLLFLQKHVGLLLIPGEEGARLGSPREFPSPMLQDAALEDFTGDGVPELVLLSAPKEVIVAHWKGDSLQELLHQSVEVWYDPTELVLADFTGDGVVDAALFGGGGRLLTVLAGKGGGQFHTRGSEFFWVDVLPVRKQAVDLEGDGRADLILASPYTVHVLRNGGQPRGISQLAVGEFLAAGDLNGDGADELLLPAERGVDVLWNDGKGGLLRAKLFRAPVPGPGATLQERGRQTFEIVVEDQRVFELRDLSPVAAYAAKDLVFVLLARTEVDPWLRERRAHELHWARPDGTVLGSLRLELGEMQPILAGGDLDGDGNPDAVMLHEKGLLVLWGGTSAVTPYSLPGRPYLLAVGDLMSDGLDEVVLVTAAEEARLISLSFLHREPVLSAPLLVFDVYAVPMALALGDFDGDGLLDAAAAVMRLNVDEAARTVSVKAGEIWLHCSRAGTKTFAIVGWPEGDAPWPLTGLGAGDFTNDGLLDLALTSVAGAGIFLLPGRGDGSFASPRRFPVPCGHLLRADLDGNGVPELLASRVGGNPATWVLWNGGAP